MLADALGQYLVWKQWKRWLLVAGCMTRTSFMPMRCAAPLPLWRQDRPGADL